jgi:hypothetical protein
MPTYSYSQKQSEFSLFSLLHILSRFFAYNFLGAFLKADINEFEISINFCVFDAHLDIMEKKKLKNLGVILALFEDFENVQFIRIRIHFAKSKQ